MSPRMFVNACLAVFITLFALVCGDRADMDENQFSVTEFDVKPGVEGGHFEHIQGPLTCKFVYKAMGGTHERWSMVVGSSEDHTEWACEVSRPGSTSYLYFEEFSLQINGAQLKEVHVEGESGNELSPSEYIVNEQQNLVQQNPGKFNSKLNRAEIYAIRGKSEL